MVIEQQLVPWVLRLHAASGGIALFVAPLAMLVRKGGSWHRRWGKAFFYCMIVVCATAIFLGLVHPQNFWLALVAIFSFHMIGSGYRALYFKKLHEGQKPEVSMIWAGMSIASSSQIDQDIADVIDTRDAAAFDEGG